MNLVLDLGNSQGKAALFHANDLTKKFTFQTVLELKNELANEEIENAIVSCVTQSDEIFFSEVSVKRKKLKLSYQLPLPVQINYGTPQTLGVDRIAGACGARALFPTRNCLIIDAGTCINYEFLTNEGVYMGGAISPGVEMRFKAMHTFTSRLPLAMAKAEAKLTGETTDGCLQSGVMNGIRFEMEGAILQYQEKYADLTVLLCGGDAPLFENKLKPTIFAAPDLVLTGLNSILSYNAAL
jgi:type III pantothenate kinase